MPAAASRSRRPHRRPRGLSVAISAKTHPSRGHDEGTGDRGERVHGQSAGGTGALLMSRTISKIIASFLYRQRESAFPEGRGGRGPAAAHSLTGASPPGKLLAKGDSVTLLNRGRTPDQFGESVGASRGGGHCQVCRRPLPTSHTCRSISTMEAGSSSIDSVGNGGQVGRLKADRDDRSAKPNYRHCQLRTRPRTLVGISTVRRGEDVSRSLVDRQ